MNEVNKNHESSLASRLASLPDDFQDFSEVYARDIQPALAAQEIERQKAWGKAKKFIAIAVVAGLVLGGGAFFLFKSIFAIFIGVVVAAGLCIYGFVDLNNVKAHAKQMMINPIASKFGITYNEKPSETAEANLQTVRSLDLVPSWDRKSLQDEMIGERNGIPFEFFEAHLEDKRTSTDSNGRTSTTWVTVFRGQCWVIKSPKEFHGVTRVSRDSGVFNALGALSDKISRAKLESPEFEKAFEVYTTDQVESRFLLTPDVMQAFLDLERTYKGQKLRATFEGNKIYVALEGGDLFEPGSMFGSLDDPNRVADLLEDIATVFHLVDVLGN